MIYRNLKYEYTQELLLFCVVIGRGGEQITRLQSESGCKIQMERSRGTVERQCTLTGTREAIR